MSRTSGFVNDGVSGRNQPRAKTTQKWRVFKITHEGQYRERGGAKSAVYCCLVHCKNSPTSCRRLLYSEYLRLQVCVFESSR